jgi:hypothetical protein
MTAVTDAFCLSIYLKGDLQSDNTAAVWNCWYLNVPGMADILRSFQWFKIHTRVLIFVA